MNPNSENQNPNRTRFTNRAKALAAGAVAVGVVTFGVSQGGESDQAPEQQVEIQPHGENTAWDLARNVKEDGVSQREVSNIISEQADEQGYPGVEPNEVYTLPDDLVSEEAEQAYAPAESLHNTGMNPDTGEIEQIG